jgi:hypothetical protein
LAATSTTRMSMRIEPMSIVLGAAPSWRPTVGARGFPAVRPV